MPTAWSIASWGLVRPPPRATTASPTPRVSIDWTVAAAAGKTGAGLRLSYEQASQLDDCDVLLYLADAQGKVTAQANPNGSLNNIAGIYSPGFNVLGLMPHPENLIDSLTGGTDGRGMFESLMGGKKAA